MHEMSIISGMLGVVRDEMAKHGLKELTAVRLVYGKLANVVPEALELAFEIMTEEQGFKNVQLTLVEVPAKLKCRGCGVEFTPEDGSIHFAPCPTCGEELGHSVLSGRELYIENIEAE